jgi:omega-amidase
MKVAITLAQIQSEFGNPQKNYDKVKHILDQIQASEHHLIILPELWSSGFDLKQSNIHYEADITIIDNLSRIAKTKHIWIAGTYITKENDQYYNTFILNAPNGDQFSYHKTHLIRLMNEHKYFQPGQEFVAVNTPFANIGLSICYDLRFPIQFQQLSHSGCNLFLLPAAWPIARINHWQTLIQARAIENQAFFVACNAVGGTHRETFGGHSAVLSPWGEYLLQANHQDEFIETIEIDSETVPELRNKFPTVSEQMADQNNRVAVKTVNYSD